MNVEGVVPESPLGPTRDMAGLDVLGHLRDCTYESVLQVKGLGPAYSVKTPSLRVSFPQSSLK
jgi:hypothetical protein